jgi:hypothetical protein
MEEHIERKDLAAHRRIQDIAMDLCCRTMEVGFLERIETLLLIHWKSDYSRKAWWSHTTLYTAPI